MYSTSTGRGSRRIAPDVFARGSVQEILPFDLRAAVGDSMFTRMGESVEGEHAVFVYGASLLADSVEL